MGCDASPLPSTLTANAVTAISVNGGQNDDEMSNTWLHISASQDKSGIVDVPHTLPEVESEYVMMYDCAEPSIPFEMLKYSYHKNC